MNKQIIVEFILQYLNENFNYLILRNYENLPEDEGHDIDILISRREEVKINIFLKIIKEKFNVDIYQTTLYKNLRSSLLVMDNYILHLDFFFDIQWLNVPLFDTDSLLKNKCNYKNFYVLDKLNSEKQSWYLYIIRNGNVKEKYKKLALNYENHKDKSILLSLNDRKRKEKLVFELLNKSYLNFIVGVYTSISIKVKKLFNPYARIIYLDKSSSKHIETLKEFIFISYKEYRSDIKLKDILKIYFSLTNENLVIVNNQTHKSWIKLLSKYMVTSNDNLKVSVREILWKDELK